MEALLSMKSQAHTYSVSRSVGSSHVLKSLLKDNYKQKNNEGLLHDDEASLGAVLMGGEYYETLMQRP